MSGATTAISIPLLRADLNGRVTAPGEPGYDEGRTVFYGGIDRRPLAIVRAADAGDVSRAIALARETGAELAIRSGGHSIPGHSTTEGGIVLDLGDLNGLEIDVEARTAWLGGGVTTGRYTDAAAEHGLATPFGDTGSVGIGGLTLGGGIGYLVRKHGLTIDNPARRRGRHRGRAASARGRRVAPGPVLGASRRRWQLRRRHLVPAPSPRPERNRRRNAHLAGDH